MGWMRRAKQRAMLGLKVQQIVLGIDHLGYERAIAAVDDVLRGADHDDAELVHHSWVVRAHLVRGCEVLLRHARVVRRHVFHSDVQHGQVAAAHQPGRGAVRGHGLVVLALGGERVPKAEPCRAKV